VNNKRTVRSYIETLLAGIGIYGGVAFFYWLFRGDFDRLQVHWKLQDTIGDLGIVLLIFTSMAAPIIAAHYLLKFCRNYLKENDIRDSDEEKQ